MSWLFPHRQPVGERPGMAGITPGLHRSPGLGALADELDGRKVEAILDLGASSNDNLTFLTQYCDHIAIRDLAGTSGQDLSRPRSVALEIDVDSLELEPRFFDVILVWDLLHYTARAERPRFIARLAERSREGTLVLITTAASTPIPASPVHFRIKARDQLLYEVVSDRRVAPPQLRTREVEQLMAGFTPMRFFQLRNGLQEFLFRRRGSLEREDSQKPT